MEFWTTPSGSWKPFEWIEEAKQMVSHFAVCPKADQFRKGKHGPEKPEKPKLSKKQEEAETEKKRAAESGKLF